MKLRDAALKEQVDARASVQELRDTLAELTAKAQAAKPEIVKHRLVYIQFRGDLKRSLINDLRASLETGGYSLPGAERLAGEYDNLVKYFRAEGQPSADALLEATTTFFAARGCPISLRAVPGKSSSVTAPLELWLAHSCKS